MKRCTVCVLSFTLIAAFILSGCKNVEDKKKEEKKTLIQGKAAVSDIGIWYSVWYVYNKEDGTKFAENSWKTLNNIKHKPLLPDGTYGCYDSLDEDVIKFHLQQMSEAGIDFIIMDQTNNIDAESGLINQRALKMAKCIKEWNDDPSNRPIRYCSAIGAIQWSNKASSIEDEAYALWTRYCKKDFGTDKYHYYLDGKPLMIVYGDNGRNLLENYTGKLTYTENFTVRYAGNLNTAGYYGWAYPQGTVVSEEVAVVMPGWNNQKGWPAISRDGGKWYQDAWNILLQSDIKPKIVVINSFNEYAEETAVFPADTSGFPDGWPVEKWTDGDGNVVKTLYWDMTKDFIDKYRTGDYTYYEDDKLSTALREYSYP